MANELDVNLKDRADGLMPSRKRPLPFPEEDLTASASITSSSQADNRNQEWPEEAMNVCFGSVRIPRH
jgi:hypothetical protein